MLINSLRLLPLQSRPANMPAKAEKSPTYIASSEPVTEPGMFKQIYDLEMNDPERVSANLKILGAVGLFAGGIAFLRFAGDLITPTF